MTIVEKLGDDAYFTYLQVTNTKYVMKNIFSVQKSLNSVMSMKYT